MLLADPSLQQLLLYGAVALGGYVLKHYIPNLLPLPTPATPSAPVPPAKPAVDPIAELKAEFLALKDMLLKFLQTPKV